MLLAGSLFLGMMSFHYFLRLRFEGYQVEAGLLKVIPKPKTPKSYSETDNTELFIAQKEIFNGLID